MMPVIGTWVMYVIQTSTIFRRIVPFDDLEDFLRKFVCFCTVPQDSPHWPIEVTKLRAGS
jgi:hypothetical protein